jgi:hypothetical protein
MANTPTTTKPSSNTARAETAVFSNKVRRMFGLSLHGWENWMIGSLIVAAAFALIAGFATWQVVRLQRLELADSKTAFDLYKLTVDGQVADAKKEGIDAGKAAGDALVRAAALEKQAAELKAKNLELEVKIQPRRLSGKEKDSFISALSGVPKPPTIAVVSRLLDPDSNDFADDISAALMAAGWHSERYRNWTMSVKGVFVATAEGTTVDRSDPSIGGLERALAAAGVSHAPMTVAASDNATMTPYFQPNVLYVLVGAKP